MSKTNKYGKTNKEVKESRRPQIDKYWQKFCEQELEDVDFFISPNILNHLRKEA